MKQRLIHIIIILLLVSSTQAQDPAFSQFFSSPLNINPALTGTGIGDWRVVMNARNQWNGPASPYNTATISGEYKLMVEDLPEKHIMGVGAMLLYDKAMAGIYKASFASVNLDYHLNLNEGYGVHRIGAGIGGSYGRKYFDYSRLMFPDQFTGSGFNTSLPNGEAALYNMQPTFSANAGVLYNYSNEKSNLDIGAAGFHLNKPKQTVMEDPDQILLPRWVVHANYERLVRDNLIVSLNTIYQNQTSTDYYSIGGALGYNVTGDFDEPIMVNIGLWYWSKNAVIPFVGMIYKQFQFGFSYDLTISDLNQADQKPTTWEISLILHGKKRTGYYLPCPWK
jgi:type IX secretion system PorP/SprF family membrane protein